jgi:hypothetical protein
LAIDEFRKAYLDLLCEGQEYDLYGFKPAGVLAYLQTASNSAVTLIRMRAAKSNTQMSSTRCHKAWKSEYLWQLTTDDGARFLYFRDGQRWLIFVSATDKMKEKEFYNEIKRADQRRLDYLRLKMEGKLR